MVQEKDREWRERLQKEELLQEEDILEKNGIACVTDADYMQLPMQSQFNKREL